MPTGTIIYLSIDTIFYIIFDLAIALLFFDFKKNRSVSIAVLAVGIILNNIDSSISTVYLFDQDHFLNSTAYQISDSFLLLTFNICFLCFFVKGHPIRNYVIWRIAGFVETPIMALFTFIRKGFNLGPSLMYCTSLSEFAAVAATGVSLLFTYLLLSAIWKKLKQQIMAAPLTPYWFIAIIFCLFDFLPLLSFENTQYFVGDIHATMNMFVIGLVCFSFIALAGTISAAVIEYQNTNRNLQLMQVEIELQHTYYKTVQAMQLLLRRLRHDLANHLEVIKHLPENSSDADRYSNSLSDTCLQIDRDAQAMLRWHSFQLEEMTIRETYAIYAYLDRLLKGQSVPWEAVSVKKHRNPASAILTLTLPHSKKQSFWKRKARRDLYFQLIQRIAASHKGGARWEEGADFWNFIIEVKLPKTHP